MSADKIKIDRKKNLTGEQVRDYVLWTFKPENINKLKNYSANKICQVYENETGIKLSQSFVLIHRNKWILIDGELYDKEKIPYELLKSDKVWEVIKDHVLEN